MFAEVVVWTLNLLQDHFDVVQASNRLDVCEKCDFWDKAVEPRVLKMLAQWQRDVERVQSGYFDAFVAKWPQVVATHAYVSAFKAHLTFRANARRRKELLGTRVSLYELETAIKHQLNTEFSACEAKVGLLELMSLFEGHFGLRDAWKAHRQACWDQPRAGSLNIMIDFAEHHTLPFGPAQTGKCFYANYVLGCTVLGIICWDDERRSNYIFLSEVKEQSSLFAQACLMRVLELERADQPRLDTVNVLCDSGPHFLSGRFLAYVLVHIRATYKNLRRSTFAPAPAGHGKGPVDGEFGAIRGFRRYISKRHWVNSVERYAELLQQRADVLYEQNTSRPVRHFIAFAPAEKVQLRMLCLNTARLRGEGMPLKVVPFWSSSATRAGDTKLYGHSSPNAPPDRECWPAFEANDPDDETDASANAWRTYYRRENPDGFVPSIVTMRKQRQMVRQLPSGSRKAALSTLVVTATKARLRLKRVEKVARSLASSSRRPENAARAPVKRRRCVL